MSIPQNVDQWMMDALDGHISAHDRAALEAYLSEHPAERSAFKQMLRVDHALSAEPLAPAPKSLKLNVMAALPRATATPQPANARPMRLWLTAPQAVFLAMVATMLAVVIGLGAVAFISIASPAIASSSSVPPATAAIVNSAGDAAATVMHATAALTRVIFSQPVTWIVILISVWVAFLWARLVVILLLPTLKLVLA